MTKFGGAFRDEVSGAAPDMVTDITLWLKTFPNSLKTNSTVSFGTGRGPGMASVSSSLWCRLHPHTAEGLFSLAGFSRHFVRFFITDEGFILYLKR